MNKVKEILLKYFNEKDIDLLFNDLSNKQRSNIINDKYFAKVGINSNELFFNNQITEINLYKNNSDNKNLPDLIDSYIDDNICLIVLKRIDASPIGETRNNFDINISKEDRLAICNSILNIKNIEINCELDNSYNREERLSKYLEKSKEYISKITYNKILNLKPFIAIEKYDRVIAHGDLICPNIMVKNSDIFIIDWEFISYKPKYYDLIYFLLFSKKENSIDLLNELNIDINESLKDGIIICLKEISNNAKLFGKLDDSIVNNNINRWINELNNILRIIKEDN